MNCRTTQLKMGDRLAECLSDAELKEMDAHLENCAACRRIWAEECRLWGITGSCPEPPKVGSGFTAEVLNRARAEAEAEEAGHKVIAFPHHRRRWIPAVAAAVLFVLFAGTYLVRFTGIEEGGQVAEAGSETVTDEMIIENLDILEELELLENLELYEDLDVIEALAVN